MSGLLGEDIVDDKCWMVKTHTPWCIFEAPPFTCNKMMVVVRNPIDSFKSWLELVLHGNHMTKSDFNLDELYPKFWDTQIREICDLFGRWFDAYL